VPEALPCATLSRALGEPLLGTASRARGWVLLEQPGPWGREAVLQSRLDRDLAEVLDRRAREVRARLLLIRRPGRGDGGGGRCFVAHSGPRDRWLEGRVLDDPAELLDLDFGRVVAGERPGFGEPVAAPLYLVCTNGRHDRCCATYGRPLALALAAAAGERVWECSHVGGDRFAANLVCLPGGHYFGHLGPEEGPGVADRYERGLLDLDHYRGRCSDPWAVQAAEWFARRHSSRRGVEDLAVDGVQRLDREVSAVHFVAADGGRLRVVVRAARTAEPRLLTCTSDEPQPPMAYTLLALRADEAP
jgi:Sucrase/ferredoxin-like